MSQRWDKVVGRDTLRDRFPIKKYRVRTRQGWGEKEAGLGLKWVLEGRGDRGSELEQTD